MKTLHVLTILLIALIFALASCSDNGPVSVDENDASISMDATQMSTSTYDIPLHEDHIGTVNSEFQTGICPAPPEGQEDWFGWHFVMPGNNVFTALEVEFENAGVITADPFPGVFTAVPNEKHAYIWTETDDTLLGGSANSDGDHDFFVLSHTCPGVNGHPLNVEKTVETTYSRTHDWSIDKEVETEEGHELDDFAKVWLYIDGTGDESAEWTVEVTYEGYEDSDWNVSGEITIKSTSFEVVTITDIVDKLAGDKIDYDCGEDFALPYNLASGEVLTCTYSEDVDGQIEGDNVVSVTVDGEDDPYTATEEIEWGDPETEVNKEVTIKDLSDLLGAKELGTLDADDFDKGDSEKFDYDYDFVWENYGTENCGNFTYDNTAEVFGDDKDKALDSADASLKVNVQCYVYESAWALDMNNEVLEVYSFCDNGFSNWGWSNHMGTGSYVLDLYAGAGQCDINKGTYVGYVEITYNGGFDYEYHIEPGFDLEEYHIYAGSDMFPKLRNGRDTVAPGQYSIMSPLNGNIYVIAHGVVGFPDPDFGP